MAKPTRLKIAATAVSIALAATVGFAGILETGSEGQFEDLRQAVGDFVSGFFPFWIVFFISIAALVGTVLMNWNYSAMTQRNTLFAEDGVLLYDRQQHIAISIGSMKEILVSLAQETEEGRASQKLFDTGQIAGARFGREFSNIYTEQIQAQGRKPWAALSNNEKLNAWEQYDGPAGWGQIRAHQYDRRSMIEVIFVHPSLYEGEGGELFSWLLAGYSGEVLASILNRSINFDPAMGFVRDDGILRLEYTY